ncbi:hypothetical protein BJ684DRAFT_17636 [Piptocephalis cylindrospora]|uniref:Uncharacterized protein n=1 Tax=Piptocephalis cylindrospora TaxID=1907219 RepID=A0A4P9XZA7_9FUNG|nr:hypothetical protein BJ684DRAFT_17636 [Piptocephalis cylindrospora]|eukprot:RKP11813.1 hypothetical protein BJ684DRAFT_17636 [Piptocephalis cylindrospora]
MESGKVAVVKKVFTTILLPQRRRSEIDPKGRENMLIPRSRSETVWNPIILVVLSLGSEKGEGEGTQASSRNPVKKLHIMMRQIIRPLALLGHLNITQDMTGLLEHGNMARVFNRIQTPPFFLHPPIISRSSLSSTVLSSKERHMKDVGRDEERIERKRISHRGGDGEEGEEKWGSQARWCLGSSHSRLYCIEEGRRKNGVPDQQPKARSELSRCGEWSGYDVWLVDMMVWVGSCDCGIANAYLSVAMAMYK